jgi:hypothetical protein
MSTRSWTPGPWELRGDYVCLPLAPGVKPEEDDTPPLFDIDTWEARHADGELVALAPEMAEAILGFSDRCEGTFNSCFPDSPCASCEAAEETLYALAGKLRRI